MLFPLSSTVCASAGPAPQSPPVPLLGVPTDAPEEEFCERKVPGIRHGTTSQVVLMRLILLIISPLSWTAVSSWSSLPQMPIELHKPSFLDVSISSNYSHFIEPGALLLLLRYKIA